MFYKQPFKHVGYINDFTKTLYKIKVTHPSLRRRSAPSGDAEPVGIITDFGVYNIIQTQGAWGQLEDGSWIMLVYTKKID